MPVRALPVGGLAVVVVEVLEPRGRPAGGTRVAHSIVAGDDGIAFLAYGTREPDDIAYYPRSNKVYFRGVGLMTRLERLDYDDGEPADY